MAYTETTNTGYGKRIGNSLKGIVTGFVLFIAGTALLFWNEGNFVKTKKALNEGESVVVPVSDVNKLNSEFNGKFVHATAVADTKDTITDDLFGVKERAVALNRKVEYYQWVEKVKTETKDKIGGSQEQKTTYTYQQEWTNKPVNSSEFKDPNYQGKNFVLATVEDKKIQAEYVSFGAYQLPDFIVASIAGNSPVKMSLTSEQMQEWEKSILRNTGKEQQSAPIRQDTLLRTDSIQTVQTQPEWFHVTENIAYIGRSSSSPQVGDVRVTIVKTEPTIISILAKVNGNTFERFLSKNGKDISLVAQGTVSVENMFAGAHSSNSTWTWVLRLVGLLVIIFGLKSMFSILETLLKVLPFLANIVAAGVGLVVSVVGFVWALAIVAVAWLFYRPLIAIALVGVIVGLIFLLKKKAKEKIAASNEKTLV